MNCNIARLEILRGVQFITAYLSLKLNKAIRHKSNYFCTQDFDHLIFQFHWIFQVITANDIPANQGLYFSAELA